MTSNAKHDFERTEVPTNPNYHRLSAMIEKYNSLGVSDEEDGEDIFMPSSRPTNGQDSRSEHSLAHSNPVVALTNSHSSVPSSIERNVAGFSPGNRESIISTYSGTIHEGVPISYVVTSDIGTTVKKEPMNEPILPPLPTTVQWQSIGNENDSRTLSAGQEINVNALKSPSASNRNAENGMNSLDYMNNNEPLTLLSIENNKNLSNNAPSIGSGNLASESGHSHNHSNVSTSGFSHVDADTNNNIDFRRTNLSSIRNVIKEESYEEQRTISVNSSDISKNPSKRDSYKLVPETSLNISRTPSHGDIQTVSESKSIVSSILPELETKLEDSTSGRDASIEIVSAFHPAVPPRSNRRPRSTVFIKENLDNIQEQLAKEMQSSQPSRNSSQSFRSEGFYSATEHDTEKKEQNLKTEDQSLPVHEHLSAKSLPSLPNNIQRHVQQQDHLDSEYEDIPNSSEDEHLDTNFNTKSTKPSSTLPRSKLPKVPKRTTSKTKAKKDVDPKRSRELRSFDIDTIAQLLNVTKGTLIGSEFANLGMKIEEKRALERLVDSLSRLSADMVLDPEKFTEGLKRLDRATRALDGF